MIADIGANTQAILLLTAPLLAAKRRESDKTLSGREYRTLVKVLLRLEKEPADLLTPDADYLIQELATYLDPVRLRDLLGRGFLLSQAIERWRSRSIWVLSRADIAYPRRIKRLLRDAAPPIIYGCGDDSMLDAGGLAVVGSRAADERVLEIAEHAGELAGLAGVVLVSGGARGVDSIAMRSAAAAGGRVVGVLADRLDAAVVNRDNRALLMEQRLVLITPYDPSAGFNVGHAMQRNKLIYALADASLVVSSDLEKGGTWAGAIEQLEKLRFGPLFVPATESSPGLDALVARGASRWPEDLHAEGVRDLVSRPTRDKLQPEVPELPLMVGEPTGQTYPESPQTVESSHQSPAAAAAPKQEHDIAALRALFTSPSTSWTVEAIVVALHISQKQAKDWLKILVSEGLVEKQSRPVRYRAREPNRLLPL